MTKSTHMTEAELADYYADTHDLSEFDEGEVVPVTGGRRAMVLSVRFSPEELDVLRKRAEEQGVKVTALVRSAALMQASPIDSDELRKVAEALVADGAKLGELIGLPSEPSQRRRPKGVRIPRSGGHRRSG
jgi:Mobilization protein NikA